jgi:exosome complex RNA-binding protein Rrp42 (RNase PH superfamily)
MTESLYRSSLLSADSIRDTSVRSVDIGNNSAVTASYAHIGNTHVICTISIEIRTPVKNRSNEGRMHIDIV